MTLDQFLRLENSLEALDQFNPDSDSNDELAIIESHRHPRIRGLTGDGAASTEQDSESSGSRFSRRGRSRRSTAAPGKYTEYFVIESESEETDRSESSTDELSIPKPRTGRVLRRRGKSKNQISSSRHHKHHKSYVEGTRKSSRQRLSARRSMRERLEDDLSEIEITRSRQQKYTGAREVFQELPWDNEFRQRHFACCSTCNYYEDDDEKGLLVFCQGCSSSYHQFCLGPRASREHLVTKIDEGKFILQCRRCLGISHDKHDIRPHLGYCAVCKEEGPMSHPLRERLTSKEEQQQRVENGGTDPETIIDMAQADNPDNVLFRCASCQRGFHVEHLPPKDEADVSENFNEYSKHWQCQDCANAPGEVEALLAWRPVQSQAKQGTKASLAELVPEIEKEYLIKWKSKSYFRATWMRGDWVWGHSNHAMIRAFYKSPKSGKPSLAAEDAIPEDNLRVDILFEVSWSPDAHSDADMQNPEMVQEAFVKFKGLNYEDSVWEVPPKTI